jgi:type IV pilus assembly protein PilM
MPALAIDIGTYSLKAISGKPGKKVKIDRIAELPNSTGIAVPTDDAAQEKLSILVESFMNDNDLPKDDVRLALPESVVSTKVIEIPPLSDAELASAIGWQAEQHIPIPPEELSLEYQVLYRPPKGDKSPMRVLLVGSRKTVVERFVNMFYDIGIEPTAIETHSLAILRALQFESTDPNTLVINIGSSVMDMTMVYVGEIQFVISHMNAGQLLTRSLEQGVGLATAQAEQYKRSYGLNEAQFQGKVKDALLPGVNLLINEMKKSVQFFINKHPQETVQRVVLAGGSAALPGFVQQITNQLGAEVLVAAPFAGIDAAIPETINHPSMTVCMGLLMQER